LPSYDYGRSAIPSADEVAILAESARIAAGSRCVTRAHMARYSSGLNSQVWSSLSWSRIMDRARE
jgi:hypothetical protein